MSGPGGVFGGGGGHHRHRRWAGAPFGPPFMPPFGPPPRRARRGDVRRALLALLAEKPMHGYEIIGELEQRSGGAWRPSPGSIYPTLQMLADEGLLSSTEQDGRRVYSITDAGKAELEKRQAKGGGAPWDQGEAADEGAVGLRDAVFRLMGAARQVGEAGSRTQLAAAAPILDDARRKLYTLLAEDEAKPEDAG